MALTENPLAEAAAARPTFRSDAGPKRRGTLLIVDDEDGPRQSLRVIFKDEYDLLMAEDCPTAIDLAQKNDIDVAVLDIRMAGMSGIEVLERLKYVKPEIEAIMMMAFETTDTIRQALRLRACDYINKPFDIATMRAAVGQAMQRRMLEGEIHNSAEKVQNCWTNCRPARRGTDRQDARRHLRQHHPRHQRPAHGHFRFRAGAQPAAGPQLADGAGGSGIHQGPAAHHRAAGGQLHRNFPALSRIFAPPAHRIRVRA